MFISSLVYWFWGFGYVCVFGLFISILVIRNVNIFKVLDWYG